MLKKQSIFFISFQHEFLNACRVFRGKVLASHLQGELGRAGRWTACPLSPHAGGQAPTPRFQQARLPQEDPVCFSEGLLATRWAVLLPAAFRVCFGEAGNFRSKV